MENRTEIMTKDLFQSKFHRKLEISMGIDSAKLQPKLVKNIFNKTNRTSAQAKKVKTWSSYGIKLLIPRLSTIMKVKDKSTRLNLRQRNILVLNLLSSSINISFKNASALNQKTMKRCRAQKIRKKKKRNH
jgi:hypothetical protein